VQRKKILSINECEVAVTWVGIVVKGYIFEADIVLSKSAEPEDRGRARLMWMFPIKIASFLCFSRIPVIWL
jgi:hypothetical protein